MDVEETGVLLNKLYPEGVPAKDTSKLEHYLLSVPVYGEIENDGMKKKNSLFFFVKN